MLNQFKFLKILSLSSLLALSTQECISQTICSVNNEKKNDYSTNNNARMIVSTAGEQLLPESLAYHNYVNLASQYDSLIQQVFADEMIKDGKIIHPWTYDELKKSYPEICKELLKTGWVGKLPFDGNADNFATYASNNKENIRKEAVDNLNKLFDAAISKTSNRSTGKEQIIFCGQNDFLSDSPREFSSPSYEVINLKNGKDVKKTHAKLLSLYTNEIDGSSEKIDNYGSNYFDDTTIDFHGDSCKNCRIIYYKFKVDITIPAHLNVDYHYGMKMHFKFHHHGNYKAFKGHANGDYSFQLFFMGENDVLPKKILQPWNVDDAKDEELDEYTIYQEKFHANGDDSFNKSWTEYISKPLINLTIFNENNDETVTKSFYFGAAISCKSNPSSKGETYFSLQFKPYLYEPNSAFDCSSPINKNNGHKIDEKYTIKEKRFHCNSGNNLDNIKTSDMSSFETNENGVAKADNLTVTYDKDNKGFTIDQNSKNNDGYAVSVPYNVAIKVKPHTKKTVTITANSTKWLYRNTRLTFWDSEFHTAMATYSSGASRSSAPFYPDILPINKEPEKSEKKEQFKSFLQNEHKLSADKAACFAIIGLCVIAFMSIAVGTFNIAFYSVAPLWSFALPLGVLFTSATGGSLLASSTILYYLITGLLIGLRVYLLGYGVLKSIVASLDQNHLIYKKDVEKLIDNDSIAVDSSYLLNDTVDTNSADDATCVYTFSNATNSEKTYYIHFNYCEFSSGQRSRENDASFTTRVEFNVLDSDIKYN